MINRSTGHQPGFSHQLLPMIFHHQPKMGQKCFKRLAPPFAALKSDCNFS
jgi:hypothetical protein